MDTERNRPELQKPGQHEGMEQQLNALLALVTELKNRPTINVTVNVPADPDVKTILGIVKAIRHAQGEAGGLSPTEEAEQAAKLRDASGPLKAAVERNQPEVPPVDAPAT